MQNLHDCRAAHASDMCVVALGDLVLRKLEIPVEYLLVVGRRRRTVGEVLTAQIVVGSDLPKHAASEPKANRQHYRENLVHLSSHLSRSLWRDHSAPIESPFFSCSRLLFAASVIIGPVQSDVGMKVQFSFH